MALYSEKVMDHFQHPRNVGIIENADGIGEVGNAKCGDIMKIYLKIDDDKISDVKFETFGCGSAIATSSIATEMIKGRTIEEALKLSNKAVVEALGAGAPPVSLTSEEDSSQLDLPVSSPEEQLSDLISLRQMLTQLEERDRRLIELRYFRNMTQVKTAQELGMTQVQVSRREKKILLWLRERLI